MIFYFVLCMAMISYTDIKSRRIPDPLVILTALPCLHYGIHGACILPLIAWLCCALLASALNRDLPYGMGDAKLLSAIALSFGVEALWIVFCLGSVLSGIFCAILLLLKKVNKKSRIAFGPFLCIAFLFYFISRQLLPYT